MANRRLDHLYKHIDVDETELSASRGKLARTLAQLSNHNTDPTAKAVDPTLATIGKKQNRRQQFAAWGLLAIAASVMAIAIGLNRSDGLDATSLEDIERFVDTYGNHEQLFAKAEALKTSENKLKRLNALAVMTMLGTDDENLLASAAGLVEDPRPEFRHYYLEYLLDYGDEASYNPAYIEALIEKETDEECLYLLRLLLKLALLNQNEVNLNTTTI